MSEILTQSKAEDAISITEDFLIEERGTSIDGDYASYKVAEQIATIGDRAKIVLTSTPHPNLDGLYVPLSKYNSGIYDEAATVLPGHIVLIPSALVEKGTSLLYPAVVSEDGLKTQSIRLHVLKQSYSQKIQYGTSMILSAAGQSETKGVGAHGTKSSDGIEAEHFATLLAAGGDRTVQEAWKNGTHINHAWRGNDSNSVMAEVSNRLFGTDIPQSTITITKQQIENGQAMLLWHEGMRDDSGNPETATKEKALVVIQSLGFEALHASNPRGIETVKELIA
jgi:hypothetical protein